MNPDNLIILLQNGEAYFPALELALNKATQEIYPKSYIFENDHTGRRIPGRKRFIKYNFFSLEKIYKEKKWICIV